MPIKSIVVHLMDDPRRQLRLRAGISLAKRFDAHLNVVYAKANPDFPAGMIGRAASLAYLTEATEQELSRAAAIKAEVEEKCSEVKSWEWHEEFGDVDEAVARWAHLSDLVIAQHVPHEKLDEDEIFDSLDDLMMNAGCPMLLLPARWKSGSIGKHILIAWKNSREGIQALRGAFSFLYEAEKVFVLPVVGETMADPPGSDVVKYLGYQGVAAELSAGSFRRGKDILRAGKEHGCDLLVLGAYESSRLREIFVGSETDHVVRHAEVPVLIRR